MGKKTKAWAKWLYWFSLAISVVLVYKTVDNLGEITGAIGEFFTIVTPFLIGLLIAYILYIPCRKVESLYRKSKKKWIQKRARTLSVTTVYILAVMIIALIIRWIIPPIAQSIIDLANNFQGYYNVAVEKISELPEDSFLKSQIISRIIEAVQQIDIKQIINIEAISQYAQGAISFANGIINTFVSIIVSVYILTSRGEILKFLKKLLGAIVEPNTYKNMENYFNSSNEIFFSFLSSQVIDAIVVGILTSVAMSILGIKYAVLLGFMIGLFNIIPYIGAIIAIVIAGIITFFTGGIEQTIIMLIVITILQQIDANIINPKIVGNSLEINPLLVIFAVTLGGAYFGIVGIFLSVPAIAIIKVLVNDFIEYRNRVQIEKEKEGN